MLAIHKKLLLLAWAAVAGFVGCQTVPVEEFPANADPSAEIENLAKARQVALEQNVNTLSPHNWGEVNTQLDEARRERDDGADSKTILKSVAMGHAYLKKANEAAQISRSSLPQVIEARRLAVEANAPTLVKPAFDAVERDFKIATEDIEDGNLGTAERLRPDLLKRYAAVELDAIKQGALGAALNNTEQARREGADQWAPRSLAQTEADLKTAAAYIDANRHDKAGVAAQAATATQAASQLLNVTRQAKIAQKTDAETLVLQRQQEEARLAAEAAAATQAATSAENQLTGAQGEVAKLQTQNTALAAQQAFNQKFDAARARFSPQEAEVLRQGNDLLIRMKGIDFASGKAAIPPKNFALLGKVIAVAKDFQAPKVTVEGHTDAVGGKALNQKLSEERAAAVVDYFAANGIDRAQLTSVGFGDQRPLASNKTKEGRAQNRRVDVILQPGADATAH